MRGTRLLLLLLVAAALGAVPAAAGGNDWGTWTIGGHGTSWSGTFVDEHHVTGFVIGTRSLVKYNRVTSFTIGGRTCDLGSVGTGYCYHVDIPANTKLRWKLTTRKGVKSSKGIVPCIEYADSFHCRYGNG